MMRDTFTELERARSALQFIPVGGHNERVRVAQMLHPEFGEAGRELWDEWRGERGNDEAESVWKSTSKPGSLTVASLFYAARAEGWTDDTEQRPERTQSRPAERKQPEPTKPPAL